MAKPEPKSPYLEAQDVLKEAMREVHVIAGLDRAQVDGDCAIAIGVTSPNSGDGKTTVALALAGSMSLDYEADVMLVDADFHTHSVGASFGLQNREGLSEVIAGRSTLESVRQRVAARNLSVVTAGTLPGDPARLARSEQVIGLIENMKRASKYVVIDLPATLRSMNAPVLAQRCDGVIVVVRHGRTTRHELERTLHLLRDANVLGVVVNRHKSSTPEWVQRALSLRT
jgi:capsular exopolysaccharide synthesis family protein